MRQNVYAPDN